MHSTRTAIAVFAIVSSTGTDKANAQDKAELRVHVYESGPHDEKTRKRALARAGKLLQDAGIGIAWVVCSSGPGEVSREAECALITRRTIVLRIVAAPAPDFVSNSALGFTVPAREGAVYTTVFTDRVRAVALAAHCSDNVLFGYAVAHEIAHALLGDAQHTASGIMAARWSATELRQAEVGVLRFSRQSSVRLRQGLEERSR